MLMYPPHGVGCRTASKGISVVVQELAVPSRCLAGVSSRLPAQTCCRVRTTGNVQSTECLHSDTSAMQHSRSLHLLMPFTAWTTYKGSSSVLLRTRTDRMIPYIAGDRCSLTKRRLVAVFPMPTPLKASFHAF